MNPSAKSTNPSAKSTNMSAKSRNRKNYEILPNQPSQSEEPALWYENEGRESQSDSQGESQSESEYDDELSDGIIEQRWGYSFSKKRAMAFSMALLFCSFAKMAEGDKS